jgi:hypothetical protein
MAECDEVVAIEVDVRGILGRTALSSKGIGDASHELQKREWALAVAQAGVHNTPLAQIVDFGAA